MAKNKHDVLCLLFLILVFTISIPIVNPYGDFPLNDDWAYAEATRRLFAQHEWQPLGWLSMTLITQAVWGTIACTLFNCSFDTLRFSIIFSGLLLLLSSYVLFRMLRTPPFVATVGATTIAFNPIMFSLMYSFMTDVLFETLLVVSTIFYIIAIQKQSSIHIGLASFFTTIATLSRQLSLCLPIAFCISYFLVSREPPKLRLAKAGAPLLASSVIFLIFEQWLRVTGRLPPMYFESQALKNVFRSSIVAAGHMSYYGVIATFYLGLFCLPILLCIVARRDVHSSMFQTSRRLALVLSSLVSILIVVLIVSARHFKYDMPLSWDSLNFMPLSWNMLNSNGIGPLTLRDTYILHLNSVPDFPPSFWAMITGAAMIGVWLFVYQISSILIGAWPFISYEKISSSLGVFIFGVVGVTSYLSPVLVVGFFDRYIAAIVPLACVILVSQASSSDRYARFGVAGAIAICVGMGIFSVLTTHDYLSWNRARWQAIDHLEQSHVADARTLDGGFEYNGYRSYDPAYVPKSSKSWWWVKDDKYMITFAPLPGMKVVRRYKYRTYFPIATRFIYVLRRPQ